MTAIMEIINTVLPVFLVMGLGVGLTLGSFLSQDGFANIRKLVFYVSLPALLFKSAALSSFSETFSIVALGVTIAVIVMTAFVPYLLTGSLPPARRGVVVQGMFRGNMIFVGIPIVAYAFGDAGVASVVVLVAFIIPVYNLLAVVVLSLPHHTGIGAAGTARNMMKDIIRNPLIIGCAAGLLYSATNLPIPLGIVRTLDLVGRMALPLALLIVGASLEFRTLRGDVTASLVASFVRLIVFPGLLFILLLLFGYGGIPMKATTVMMAGPAAASSYIMAAEMNGDEHLASSILIVSTFLSLITIIGWLYFFSFIE